MHMKKHNLLEASAVCIVLNYDRDATVKSPAHSLQNPLQGNKKSNLSLLLSGGVFYCGCDLRGFCIQQTFHMVCVPGR